MDPCPHRELEFVGEQKTDDGVNSYYKCKACDTLLVMTPSKQVIGIKGVHDDRPRTHK